MSSWTDKRPMSPHMQVWRWHLTMASSILHRFSGIALYLGMVLVVAWLFAVAAGPDYYEPLAALIAHPLGQLVLFGFTLAALYHLLSGLRHLIWDSGAGFQPKQASLVSGLIIVLSVAGSIAVWMLLGLVPGVDPLNVAGAAQ
jgi:succinate dehydrogenase / fumarate reductase cytochrome b subunit